MTPDARDPADGDDGEPLGPPSSVLRPRLAFGDIDRVPTLAELGLEYAKQVAFDWQQHRSRARWHEFVWLPIDSRRSAWVGEIHGGFGIVAELVLSAIEAEAEKALLALAPPIGPAPSPAMQAGVARAIRFFAEGQANYIVVAGHGIGNIVLRTLALHRNFDIVSLARPLGLDPARFVPRQADRGAWMSLNPSTARTLVGVAATLQVPELTLMAEKVLELAIDPLFDSLATLRGAQYHRWRGESPGVTGVNFQELTLREQLEAGEMIGFGRELLPKYVEGDSLLGELVAASRAGLDTLAAWMPGFIDSWSVAFRSLHQLYQPSRL